MSNSVQLRQQINTILKGGSTHSSLNQLGVFLHQNRVNALEVVEILKSLHMDNPNRKVLNRFDAVFLKRQDEFPDYATAIQAAGINRILPRGFGQQEFSETLIQEINYRFAGQQITFRYNLSATGSKVNPTVSYEPRNSCLALLEEKIAAAQKPARKTRFSLKF